MQMMWSQADWTGRRSELHTCFVRKVMMERPVLRTAVSETVDTTAGTQRGVSLFLPPDTQGTTPWTGEIPVWTRTPKYFDGQLFRTCSKWVKKLHKWKISF